MSTSYCILLIACLFAIGVQCLDLANTQYPILKGNRQRNNQLTGSIVCSSIAPGRTTVLNDTWASTDTKNAEPSLPPILGQDAIYVLISDSGTNYAIRRYAIAGPYGGDYSITQSVPTILQDGSVALSSATQTVLLAADLTELFAPINNIDNQIGYTSLLPYQGSYLLRADESDNAGLISVLNLTNNASNSYWATNFTRPGTIRQTLVYSPSGVDVLVVVTDSGPDVKIYVDSNSYTIAGLNLNGWIKPFIVDAVLYVFLNDETMASFDLVTKSVTGTTSWGQYGYYMDRGMIIRGSKGLASLKSGSAPSVIVEVFSNKTIISGKKFAGHPTFSIPDNVAVFTTSDGGDSELQLMALDWDTWEVKATGLFDQVSPFTSVSEAVFDENCNVFVTVGDGTVHRFNPLPIQDVKPVLECIDEFNVAYFTYNNYQSEGFRIPYVVDRNALSPDNIAPITLFNEVSADIYPFSTRVQLQNPSATYQWRLEDYLLTFSVTPQLACPRNISIVATFITSGKFNETFADVVVNALVTVTGIRDTRVSVNNIVIQNNVAKRGVKQGASSIELELQVGAGNSSEPTSAEVVKNLIDYQSNNLGYEVAINPDAPSNTQLDGISPKVPPVTGQSGVLTPIVPPVASPTNNPPPSQPTTEVTPQNVPATNPTSSGSRVMYRILFAIVLVILSC